MSWLEHWEELKREIQKRKVSCFNLISKVTKDQSVGCLLWLAQRILLTLQKLFRFILHSYFLLPPHYFGQIVDTQIFGIKFHFEMKCIQTYILLFLSLIFICLSKKSHVQFTYFEIFTDLIELFEMFTDLFVLVDNIDSAGLITPVRLVWELRWKRWQWLQYDCKYDENYDHLWEVSVHGSSDDDIVEPVPVDVVHCHWVAKVGPHLGSNCFSHQSSILHCHHCPH